ncbi:MAG TPA: alpha/beta hydrolase [Candidatus Wunengus californicus]|uniref:alpha/beta hydrolase n=1 Tax=Candidatus Wunengus californicus TaxID=3367619 RepID=UPI004028C003
MRIEIPDDSSKIVVACHGYGSNSNDRKTTELGKKLLINGIGLAKTTFPSDYGDRDSTLIAWINALGLELDILNHYNIASIGLFGSSLGGVASLYVASTDPRINAIVTIATPYEDAHKKPPLKGLGLEEVSNLLVIHGKRDEVVGYENAKRLYETAKEPKDIFLVPGADHRFSSDNHRKIATDRAVDWFKQYLN